MKKSMRFRTSKGKRQLLEWYRTHSDPEVRRRAQIVLLLLEGHPWRLICMVMFCSARTVALWKRRFETGGIDALSEESRGCRARASWTATVVAWVLDKTPRDFGFVRSRWCCAVIVLLLWRQAGVRVSAETVRRRLRGSGLVWRRPRPVLRPIDPDRKVKLRRIRALLAHLPEDEIALFQDEVDINSNPKIGAMWMRRGDQAPVETPGTNEKRYLAGSLDWRTGQLIATEGLPREGRNSVLFVRHLEDLSRHLRRYRRIHVICDNASFHDSRQVRGHLERSKGRMVLHFLPTYAPEANPIERVWWHLHEEISRNHQCKTLEELLDLVFHWLETRAPFPIEDQTYGLKAAA